MIEKEIIICVGVSASGKTTYANKKSDYVVISRDDIRRELIDDFKTDINIWEQWIFDRKMENEVTKIHEDRLKNAIKNGKSVIIADTNLHLKNLKRYEKFVKSIDEDYIVNPKFFDLPLCECIKRNSNRLDKVKTSVILKQYENFIKVKQEYFKEINN